MGVAPLVCYESVLASKAARCSPCATCRPHEYSRTVLSGRVSRVMHLAEVTRDSTIQ